MNRRKGFKQPTLNIWDKGFFVVVQNLHPPFPLPPGFCLSSHTSGCDWTAGSSKCGNQVTQWVGPQPVGGGTSKAADGMHNGRISPGRSGSDGDGLDIS